MVYQLSGCVDKSITTHLPDAVHHDRLGSITTEAYDRNAQHSIYKNITVLRKEGRGVEEEEGEGGIDVPMIGMH